MVTQSEHGVGWQRRVLYLLCLFVLVIGGFSSPVVADMVAAPTNAFFSLNGNLNPGASVNPVYPNFTGNREFNFSLTITGSGPVAFTIRNASNVIIWQGTAVAGETLWGSGTLTVGQNGMTLTNNGAAVASFQLSLYDLPNAPYVWNGATTGSGLSSEARVNFPSDGLYTFNLGVTAGQYQFLLNNEYIQKTAVSSTSVTYFVPAGTHNLTVVQDSAVGATWQVSISDVGAPNDNLPYTKTGSGLDGDDPRFVEEWLPIQLNTATQVNLALAVTGAAGDNLALEVTQPGQSLRVPLSAVYAGETTWSTLDLPAGISLIHLTADAANVGTLAYALTISTIPTTDYTWSGQSDFRGLYSHIRLQFPSDGLYQFDLGVTDGRYQFLLDDNYIQKTAETNTSVTYFASAGLHDLYLHHDTTEGAAWSVGVNFVAATNNALPYSKNGGDLGGVNNDFSEEWLPVTLDAAQTVNLVIETTGNITDSLNLEVYGATGAVQTFALNTILGTERVWANFALNAGVNRLRIAAANGNANPMTYSLTMSTVPADGTAVWDGFSLDAGNNASIMVNFPTAGVYRFAIDNNEGFANLVLDDNLRVITPHGESLVSGSYDIEVPAGMHQIHTVQDTTFAATDWAASVTPVTPAASFFNFEGILQPGESVTPEYPANGDLDFNFALSAANGGPVNLAIVNGDGAPVWTGDAMQNETLWGSGALSAGNNGLTLTNNGATAASISLTLYYIPVTAYNWAGMSAPAGLNSHIRLNFPNDGLYTFDFGVNTGGLYQFLVDADYIQKTVAADGTVAYFVTAGIHDLYIDQDTGGGMVDWSLDIAEVGTPNDALPYHKVGGPLGGGADFTEEWLPLNLSAARMVNVALTLSGNAGDILQMSANGFTVMLFGGETYWTTLDLNAGTTLFQLQAFAGNSAPLNYDLTVYALPELPYTWNGLAAALQGANRNSHIRVEFPADGLYTFDLGVDDGRYQFFLNEEYIQKTAETDAGVTYFVPAGLHDLMIVQDSGVGADWDVTLTQTAVTPDTLPYHKTGGDLGGDANDFSEEWLPLYIGAAAEVNLQIALTGSISDSLQLAVVNAAGDDILVMDPLFGGETVWSTFPIPNDGARLYLLANGGNDAPLQYDLTVAYLPQITGVLADSYTWSGMAAADGLNSTLRLDTPISGLYHVEVFMPDDGFITLFIDALARAVGMPTSVNGFFYEFDVPLTAGLHTFRSAQDATPLTSWVVTTTLQTADAPQLISVAPVTVTNDVAAVVTLTGVNFMPGADVTMQQGSTIITLNNVTVLSANQATAVIPAGIDVGVYSITWTNPDDQSATLADAIQVYLPLPPGYTLYLPVIHRAP